MKQSVFIIALLLVLNGCEKEKPISYSSNIVGEWSWLSTCGGFSGLCSTPQSSNLSIKLVFTEDSVYREFENNLLISYFKFQLHKQILIDASDTINIVQFNNLNQEFWILHDTLTLHILGADFGSTYKRIK